MISEMVNLNQTEKQVLKALYQETLGCTGGEFGYIEDTDRCGLTKHQFAGYIGQLVKKGCFEYLDDEFHGQFTLTDDARNLVIG
jgi:hypothetical protein